MINDKQRLKSKCIDHKLYGKRKACQPCLFYSSLHLGLLELTDGIRERYSTR